MYEYFLKHLNKFPKIRFCVVVARGKALLFNFFQDVV